ncbi:MAG: enoyl-CoA hydratase/isomerase family protein [Myxococcales bacterium]|nr:enoyl-CoA hydratase/isomerase family protein [Myxococcales bacterium]
MTNKRIERVGVIGAGVMGSGIAAHLASAGVDVLLVDIVPRDAPAAVGELDAAFDHVRVRRNAIAAGAVKKMRKQKPSPFQKTADLRRISVGNLDDDLADLGSCDWIVEAVIERLDIKQSVFAKLDAVRGDHTIVSSNTSGIPLASMVEGRSDAFRSHFLVTHFFNPVRYMKLLEIVPGNDTAPAVTAKMHSFCERDLGKGVVYAKDTINFIANRIGVHGMMKALQVWLTDGYRIDEIDTIMGPAMGRPSSAIFKTADVVGLDTFGHVAKNCYDNLADDEERDVFVLPEPVAKLIEAGATGRKAGAGFYKKVGRDILVFDAASGDYVAREKLRTESLGQAKKTADVAKRIAGVVAADDRVGQFAWKVTSASLVYAANRMGEIADDVVSIDRGVRWGFNWDLGPFEIWDAIGVQNVADRLTAEGRAVPKLVSDMLAAGKTSFYAGKPGAKTGLNAELQPEALPALPGIHLSDVLANDGNIIASNKGAQLLNLGDGVACLRFTTKSNSLDGDIVQMGTEALELISTGDYDALVIGNDGKNFSVGANLMFIGGLIQAGKWKELEAAVNTFQQFTHALKYSSRPVVSAPHGMTLGGGCEVAIHSSRMQAAAETYMGLVEVGVGLIPGAGGTKEMTVRAAQAIPGGVKTDVVPFLQKSFETMALAKVATGAGQMAEMGFLRDVDSWSIDSDARIGDAKRVALQLVANNYRAPDAPVLNLPGADGIAAFDMALNAFKWSAMASEHDCILGHQIARVLCGGEKGGKVTEQQLLDIEREGFLHLCGLEKTQARIMHMLKTGKPLRN